MEVRVVVIACVVAWVVDIASVATLLVATIATMLGVRIVIVPVLVGQVAGNDTCTRVLVRVPIAVAKSISVVRHPSVDALGFRLRLFDVEVWRLLVFSVKRHLGGGFDSPSLCVVLEDLPVFCD